MNTIKDLNVASLRQEESFGFHSLVTDELAKCSELGFLPVYGTYQTALARFDESLKQATGSAITAQLTDTDHQRDTAYRGLTLQVRKALRHFNPEKAAAAQKINTIAKRYGDPTALPYIQENGALVNMLQDLDTADLKNALALIDATDWVEELQRANTEFITLFADRNQEQAAVVTGLSKEARTQTDEAYRACIRRLNALIEVNGIGTLEPMVATRKATAKSKAEKI